MSAQNIENACDMILKSLRKSGLNFSFQETSYSLYLTVRKSLAKNKTSQDAEFQTEHTVNVKTLSETKELEEIKNLKMKLTEAEDVNLRLQHECEEAVNDSEECHKKIEVLETKLSNCKDDKAKLECELEVAEKKMERLGQTIKEKDKTIYDLKKENNVISDNLSQIKSQCSTLSATVHRERKKEEKKLKKKESKDFLENLIGNSQELNFQCNICDIRSESSSKLQSHVRVYHMKSSAMQTQEIQMEDTNLQIDAKEVTSDKDV